MIRKPVASRILLLALLAALPLILILQAVLTAGELREMRAVYLRNRAAAVAARLETLPGSEPAEALLDRLADEEPALVDLAILGPQDPGPENASLDALWKGRQLFRTALVNESGQRLFRAYVPFHSASGLRIGRIDLDASGGDFLVSHARHSLLIAVLAGLAVWGLAAWSLLLERRQARLEQLANLGRLSAALAHEIRNPLGTIKGFVQLAAERAGAEAAALLEPVVGEVRRLERLVSDLLMYGRPREPVTATVDWQTLVAELAASAPASVRCLQSPGQLHFESDPELVKQALLNLVRNACESGGGEVRLSAAATKNGLVIQVADNGDGVPREIRPKLFQPFATTKPAGSGLGLPIAKRLIESLGGTLELRDNEPHGTVAEIVFRRMKTHGNDSDH